MRIWESNPLFAGEGEWVDACCVCFNRSGQCSCCFCDECSFHREMKLSVSLPAATVIKYKQYRVKREDNYE